MAYIGKNLIGILKEQKSVSTMTGDGSDTTLTLSDTPGSVDNLLVFIDGIRQQPITDYTVNGAILTFTTAPESGVIVTAIVGNHSGIEPKKNSITSPKIVDGSVIGSNIGSLTGSQVSGLASTKLTGTLPAIDGSALTGVVEHTQVTKSASDPALTTNPSDGLGTIWCNTTTGNMYVCTDVTTNNNKWINMGKGTGDIINVAPTNYTDSFPDLLESASTNYTFSGASDSDGSVAHYLVESISNSSLLAVTTAEVPAGSAHTFTTQAVGSDTNVTFVVKTKDNLGKYSSGVTITAAILNNVAPTNPTNTASFADMNKNTSQNFTFTGATDPDAGDTVTHYMVDQISNAALTVTAAEVAAGSPHAFSAGNVSSDTAVTFRVRAKDDKGNYSSGVTVSMTVLNIVYTTATGGSITTSGDYKIHTFTGNSTFTISQIGTDTDIDFLIVGGGGSAGSNYAGGGGAGGFKTSFGTSGANSSALAKVNASTVGVASFAVTVGNGPAGRFTQSGVSGGDSEIAWGTHTETANGGGGGGFYPGVVGVTSSDVNGGSGGGSASNDGGEVNGSPGMAGQGMAGGNASGGYYNGQLWGTGGGGGAGAVGNNSNGNNGGDGGTGLYSTITGSNVPYGGGGGGSGYLTVAKGDGGVGGGGNSSNSSNIAAEHGDANTGGGGGGGHQVSGGNGGSGIVVLRYKYQN